MGDTVWETDMNRVQIQKILITMVIAAALTLTACQGVDTEYTVMGDTDEVSRVTSERYTPFFATQEAALEREETPAAGSTETTAEESSSGEEDEAVPVRTMADDVNLREEPDADATILELLPKGARVELLSEDENGWYEVRYQEITGYVKEGFFQEDIDRKEAARKQAEEEQQALEEAERKQAAEEAKQRAQEAAIQKQQTQQSDNNSGGEVQDAESVENAGEGSLE